MPNSKLLTNRPAKAKARAKKSFTAKLRADMKPSKTRDPRDGKLMLIPTPLLVAEEIKKAKRGKLVTVSEIRARLAKRFKAQKTCPLVTGIFVNIIAGATEEALAAGKRPTAPWWRVVDDKGRLLAKAPPGVVVQAERLAAEGIVAIPRGTAGRFTIMGFDSRLETRSS
jgi:6-O-methylguanine DNA methyltransferase, DNA binding domain